MRSWSVVFSGIVITALVSSTAAPCQGVDLGEQYPVTLKEGDVGRGYDWTCEAEDVWCLSEFRFVLDDKFRIDVGRAKVVFGRHGTNVVWAALFPEGISNKIVEAEIGRGEPIRSIWLRFHPSRLVDLFPEATVEGQGRRTLAALGKRMAMQKLECCWHSGGCPVVPPRESITLDIDTDVGHRRLYFIDTEARTVVCDDVFRYEEVPKFMRISVWGRLQAFDSVWQAFDRDYAMFGIKPDVDWTEVRGQYRPLAEVADTDYELAAVIAEMLGRLEDLHIGVWINMWGHRGQLATYNRPLPLNASLAAVSSLVGPTTGIGDHIVWAKTNDSIGYIKVDRLKGHRIPEAFDEALAQMGDTRGLIVDLRFNVGGFEGTGKQIAGRFLERPRLYAVHQFRNGPKHDDLGPKRERVCEPRGPWRYSGPVVVLQGRTTMSSAESLVLMLSESRQVTTMGDRTAGSSGNPRLLHPGAGITATLPMWLDMTPDGIPIDGVGIAPDIQIDALPGEFTEEADPVLSAAVEHLRGNSGVEGAESEVMRER